MEQMLNASNIILFCVVELRSVKYDLPVAIVCDVKMLQVCMLSFQKYTNGLGGNRHFYKTLGYEKDLRGPLNIMKTMIGPTS